MCLVLGKRNHSAAGPGVPRIGGASELAGPPVFPWSLIRSRTVSFHNSSHADRSISRQGEQGYGSKGRNVRKEYGDAQGKRILRTLLFAVARRRGREMGGKVSSLRTAIVLPNHPACRSVLACFEHGPERWRIAEGCTFVRSPLGDALKAKSE